MNKWRHVPYFKSIQYSTSELMVHEIREDRLFEQEIEYWVDYLKKQPWHHNGQINRFIYIYKSLQLNFSHEINGTKH